MQKYYMSDSNDYKLWFEFAKNDLLVARELNVEKHFVQKAILIHSQQAIEKYLKAFLLFHKESIIRTHDLLILCKMCENFDQSFLPFEEDLAWLSTNYLQSRYPDNFIDTDTEGCKTGFRYCCKI